MHFWKSNHAGFRTLHAFMTDIRGLTIQRVRPQKWERSVTGNKGVARWIYAVTAANLSRREGCDLFQISDAPIVELIQAT